MKLLWLIFCFCGIFFEQAAYGSSELGAARPQLEIDFFDTKQGNFIALRSFGSYEYENKLLFIDCGGAIGPMNSSEKGPLMRNELNRLFDGISSCSVFITHGHDDHYDLFETVKSTGEKAGYKGDYQRIEMLHFNSLPRWRTEAKEMEKEYKESGYCDARKYQSCFSINDIDKAALNLDADRFVKNIHKISTALGPNVCIIPIRPLIFTNNKADSVEHDFNVMYKVKFAGRTILFPGDVSPQLFTRLMGVPLYAAELSDVDFYVLPHHGTNAAGELTTFYIIKPKMCVVCSDPSGRHRLPWTDIFNLYFPDSKETIRIAPHDVSAADPVTKKTETFIDSKKPMFVTCNSSGYYKLMIDEGGRAGMFDGDEKQVFEYTPSNEENLARLSSEFNVLRFLQANRYEYIERALSPHYLIYNLILREMTEELTQELAGLYLDLLNPAEDMCSDIDKQGVILDQFVNGCLLETKEINIKTLNLYGTLLYLSLKRGDGTKSLEYLDNIFTIVNNNWSSISTNQCAILDVVNIFKTAMKFGSLSQHVSQIIWEHFLEPCLELAKDNLAITNELIPLICDINEVVQDNALLGTIYDIFQAIESPELRLQLMFSALNKVLKLNIQDTASTSSLLTEINNIVNQNPSLFELVIESMLPLITKENIGVIYPICDHFFKCGIVEMISTEVLQKFLSNLTMTDDKAVLNLVKSLLQSTNIDPELKLKLTFSVLGSLLNLQNTDSLSLIYETISAILESDNSSLDLAMELLLPFIEKQNLENIWPIIQVFVNYLSSQTIRGVCSEEIQKFIEILRPLDFEEKESFLLGLGSMIT